MSIVEIFFSSGIVKALGWTLLHSLWQGLAMLILASLALWLLRKQAATWRYAVLCASMLIILAAAVITFITVYQPAAKIGLNGDVLKIMTANTTVGTERHALGKEASAFFISTLRNINGFIEHNSHYLVLFWFAGFLFFIARYAGGLLYISQLKRKGVSLVDRTWQMKALKISEKLGVTKGIRILESLHISTPVTLGYLKPVILFPIGMMGSIPADQLEAILVHEIAHILRRDYLVNLLQSLMEAFFFYNPAVWWISQKIRVEREHICDDIAVKFSSDPITYIKALTTMEELTSKAPLMANAFTGNHKRLLNRVRRMIQPAGTKARPADSLATVLVLVTMALMLGAGANLNSLMAGTFSEAGSPAINPDAINSLVVGDLGSGTLTTSASAMSNMTGGAPAWTPYQDNNPGMAPDSTKAKPEEKAAKEEEEAAKQEALAKVKDAMEQQQQAMKAYQDAMQAYQDVMRDMQVESWAGNLKWVMKSDSLDTAGMIFLSPDHNMFFSEDEMMDLDSLRFFEFNCPEPGHYEYSFRSGMPGTYEFFGDGDNPEVIIKHMDKDFQWNETNEEELRQMAEELNQQQEEWKVRQFEWQEQQNDWKDRQKEFERNIIVAPDVRVHPEPYGSYFFSEKEKGPEHFIRQELMEDRLISRNKDYIVELNSNSMYINGEKQSRDVFKKYKKLYEGATGKSLDVPVKMVF